MDQLEKLIGKYSAVMSQAIRRVCGRRHSALIPDVEQEVRLALWKRLGHGKKIEHPISYVYKVALTTALSVLRECAREQNVTDPLELETREAPPRIDPARLNEAERTLLLEQLLSQLPPEQSRALKAYLAGFNHREVSRLYGWTESKARHHIYRGMDALRARGREAVE